MITPPVAIGAFAAANLAGSDPMKTSFEAVRFGWIVFVIPFLFVFSNTLIMQGEPVAIAVDFVVALVGVWFGAAGVIGYSFRPLGAGARLLYIVAGVALLLPLGAFSGARTINLIGAGLALALVAAERVARRRASMA